MITAVAETPVPGAYTIVFNGVSVYSVTKASSLWPKVQAFFANGGELTPLRGNLQDQKRAKQTEIRSEGSKRLEALALPYQLQERGTWPTQLKEAEAYCVASDAATPMLDAIANGRGVSKQDLIDKVMANANLFRTAAGEILGHQQALLDRLEIAQSETDLDLIQW